MTNKILLAPIAFSLILWASCSQEKQDIMGNCSTAQVTTENYVTVKQEPHRYGGWYCPDNLNGFPPVNIKEWKNIPVVNGRMPTKEETQNGTSLIHVDREKYPHAHPLEMSMPKLARVYNQYSKREDIIIVIQAVKINDDSIVGYRFLNGGNGSARLNEIEFLTDEEINRIPESRFVTYSIKINTTQDHIWDIMTNTEYTPEFQPFFDHKESLVSDWRQNSNVNYKYTNSGPITSGYGDLHFGNFYIQNDFQNNSYTEKFFLLEDSETKTTELKIVGGPFLQDYKSQEKILLQWAEKVKLLSEM